MARRRSGGGRKTVRVPGYTKKVGSKRVRVKGYTRRK